MLFGKKFENSTFKILGDMARTKEALRTDGQMDIHGTKTYICLPQGETYNSRIKYNKDSKP